METIKLEDVSVKNEDCIEYPDLDSILKPLGGFGKFQWFNMVCICTIIVLCTFCELGYVFTAGELKHRCLIAECEEENSTYSDENKAWLKYAISKMSTGEYNWCYRHNGTNSDKQCEINSFSTAQYECIQFIYETDEWTIAREDWGPHCDSDKYLLNLLGSVNNAGQVIGGLLAGYLQDRYGRKTVLVSLTLIVVFVGTIKSFSVNYAMMLSLEALESAAAVGLFNGPFVLALEIVDPANRVMAGTVVSMAYPMGEALLGLVQYLTYDWRTTIRICYLPFLLVMSFYWILPESVRWLLANGREDDAITVLRQMAKMNKTNLPEEAVKQIMIREAANAKQEIAEQKNSKYKFKDLWYSKVMRWRTVCTLILWASVTFVFFAITMNSVGISENKFLNFILTGLIEIPSYFVVYFTLDRLGRKYTAGGSLLLCGISCLAAAYIPDEINWARLILYLIGKFGAAGAVFTADIYTTEMFPTFVRSTIMSTGQMVGKIALIVAPEVPLLDEIYKPLPLLIFSAMAIIGVLSLLNFPETLNTLLPETIEDAECLGKKNKTEVVDNNEKAN